MTTTLVISFPWGRYHANPWGRHVNEGAVELPPSPWRLLRALYAVWQTRAPDLPERAVHDLLAKLAEPPIFYVPRHSVAHTRHYYPDSAHRTGKSSTDATFDAFAVMEGHSQLAAHWPFELPDEQRKVLKRLAEALPYFGRADSVCEATVAADFRPDAHDHWVPLDVAEHVSDDKPVTSVLAPALPLRLDCLVQRPTDVRRGGLMFPLGTHLLAYQKTRSAPPLPMPAPRHAERTVTAVRFSVLQAGLPPDTDSLVYTDLLRLAALGHFGARVERSALAGKSADERPLREDNQHAHAHYLPINEDHRLTDLVVWAPGGLAEGEVKALHQVRRLYSRANESWRLVIRVSDAGDIADVAPELADPATVWTSVMPFTPSRYPKPNGNWLDFLTKEVTRELAFRELPAPQRVEIVDGDWAAFRRYRPSARQRRDPRQGQATRAGAFLRLHFDEPVPGPLALGHLSHFGLGLFRPGQ